MTTSTIGSPSSTPVRSPTRRRAEGKTARAGGEVGLHHVAFTMGGLDDLADQYLHLKDLGIRPHRCVNHGVTTSM